MSYLLNESTTTEGDRAPHSVDQLPVVSDGAPPSEIDDVDSPEFVDDGDARGPPPDPETATADDLVDEETRESYANILATQKFIATSEEDQRILRLQQAEIIDLLDRAEELGKNEYFNVTYFTTETSRVWQERELQDRNTTNEERPNAVRLFPNAEAAEHQRLLFQKLREDHSLEDRDELKRRHPLLFNRVVRDEARREVFKSAMEARRQFQSSMEHSSSMPLLLQQQQHQLQIANQTIIPASHGVQQIGNSSVASSMLHATKAPYSNAQPFHCLPDYIRGSVQRSAAQQETRSSNGTTQQKPEWVSDVEERLAAAGDIVAAATDASPAIEPPPKAPATLQEMLAAQGQQLRDLAISEETKYKPLLESYFRYDAMVRGKLDRLAQDLGISEVAAPLPPQAAA
jgi:GrpB-like predicted nucleotidyltransferase (UPF0157 family)